MQIWNCFYILWTFLVISGISTNTMRQFYPYRSSRVLSITDRQAKNLILLDTAFPPQGNKEAFP
jgi:hypothetical protein